jgi:hypothetical protein
MAIQGEQRFGRALVSNRPAGTPTGKKSRHRSRPPAVLYHFGMSGKSSSVVDFTEALQLAFNDLLVNWEMYINQYLMEM